MGANRDGRPSVDASPTVLVVDDDDAIRDVLRMVLEDAGYSVEVAAEGMAALDLLRARPERRVVLLDLMMPRLGGAGVLAAVAADDALRGRHVFAVMTALTRPIDGDLAQVLDGLAAPVLRKPFNLDAMLRAVDSLGERLAL